MPHFMRSAGIRIIALALLGVFSLSFALWAVFPRLAAVEHLAGGRSGPVPMPWLFNEVSNGNRLEVTVPVRWFTPRRWHIVPDDRLTRLRIDGRDVPLDGVRPGGLSDWRNGFSIDLSPWLGDGTHRFEFTLDNYFGAGSLTLRPQPGWRVLLLAAGLLPWLLALARLFRLAPAQTAALAGGLLLLCCYWGDTAWNQRNYDVQRYGDSGHLGYVQYLAEHGALPRPDQGWEYFQPPPYYIGGAVVWRWADWLDLPQGEALQAYALGYWLVFLAASAACLRLGLRRNAPALFLATAALALWPSGIIHGLRLGNDPPSYAAAAVATWFMLRWWRGGRPRHLHGMALAVAAGLLFKASASAVLAAALLLIGLRLPRPRQRRSPRAWGQGLAAAAIMLAGLGLSLARNLWYWWHGQMANWLIGNIDGLDANLRVARGLRSFIPLDIPVFLTSPWVDSRDDSTGRGNFWNYLLRSSLSGEFSFDGAVQRVVSWGWGALLLGLLLLLLRRARWSAAAAWREAPWLALSLLWLASVLCVRIEYPSACQGDFRFILPILVPFLIACVRAGMAAQVSLALLACGSVAFFGWPQ